MWCGVGVVGEVGEGCRGCRRGQPTATLMQLPWRISVPTARCASCLPATRKHTLPHSPRLPHHRTAAGPGVPIALRPPRPTAHPSRLRSSPRWCGDPVPLAVHPAPSIVQEQHTVHRAPCAVLLSCYGSAGPHEYPRQNGHVISDHLFLLLAVRARVPPLDSSASAPSSPRPAAARQQPTLSTLCAGVASVARDWSQLCFARAS